MILLILKNNLWCLLAIKYKQTLLSIRKVTKNKQKDYFMAKPRFIELTKVTSGTHDIFYPDGPVYINPEQIVHLCSVKAVCIGIGRPAITKIVFRNQKTLNVKETPEEIIGMLSAETKE